MVPTTFIFPFTQFRLLIGKSLATLHKIKGNCTIGRVSVLIRFRLTADADRNHVRGYPLRVSHGIHQWDGKAEAAAGTLQQVRSVQQVDDLEENEAYSTPSEDCRGIFQLFSFHICRRRFTARGMQYLTHFKGVKTTTADVLFCRQWFAQSVTLRAYPKKKPKRDCNSLIKKICAIHAHLLYIFYFLKWILAVTSKSYVVSLRILF